MLSFEFVTGSLGKYIKKQKSLKSRPWQPVNAQWHFVNDYHYSLVRLPKVMKNILLFARVYVVRKCWLSKHTQLYNLVIKMICFARLEGV